MSQCLKYFRLNEFITTVKKRLKMTQYDIKKLLIIDSANRISNIQLNNTPNVFGVFNGIMRWDDEVGKFMFLGGSETKEHFVSKSTLFKVRPEFLDDFGYLLPPNRLTPHFKEIYDSIDETYKTIYNRGKDECVI